MKKIFIPLFMIAVCFLFFAACEEPVLDKIKVYGQYQTQYVKGQELNLDDTFIIVTMSDKTTRDSIPVTSGMVDITVLNVVGNNVITVSYALGEITKTATFIVTVTLTPQQVKAEEARVTGKSLLDSCLADLNLIKEEYDNSKWESIKEFYDNALTAMADEENLLGINDIAVMATINMQGVLTLIQEAALPNGPACVLNGTGYYGAIGFLLAVQNAANGDTITLLKDIDLGVNDDNQMFYKGMINIANLADRNITIMSKAGYTFEISATMNITPNEYYRAGYILSTAANLVLINIGLVVNVGPGVTNAGAIYVHGNGSLYLENVTVNGVAADDSNPMIFYES